MTAQSVASPALRTNADVTRDWVRAMSITQRLLARELPTLAAVVQEAAVAHPDAPALIGNDETLSYGALAGRANQYARWALAQGLGAGEAVALLMPNRPDYAALWLGLTSVGCVVALSKVT